MINRESGTATLWRASDSTWRALVEQSLDGRALESLATRSDDCIPIEPVYRRPDSVPTIRCRSPAEPWAIIQRIDDPDVDRARDIVNADLAGGATGIELVFAGSFSAARSGFGLIRPDPGLIAALSGSKGLHVRLDGGPATYTHYSLLSSLLRALDLESLTLSFDPLAEAAAHGGFDRPLAEIQGVVVSTARDFWEKGFVGSPVVADGRVWSAGGASEAQEIAGIIGSAVNTIRLLIDGGLTPRQALDSVGLIVDAGANQHLTIAKLRALRLCHARIAEAFDIVAIHARIHAETSWRTITRYEGHMNILRAASAAFAAAIGGANSITLLPFTIGLGLPDAFARRLARNTQVILLEESGLARIDDPAAGSGAIESLTEAIAKAAWMEFQELEAAGGLPAALRAGTFQSKITSTRQARTEKIAHRKIAITGVSSFPSLEHTDMGGTVPCSPISKPSVANAEPIPQLHTARFAEPFEALRDRAAALAGAGKTPRVFLANLGNTADFAESAQAATNFFAAGGIVAVAGGGFDTPAEVARAYSVSGAQVACITGAATFLHRHAAATARALNEHGAARIYVMGSSELSSAIDAVLDDDVDAIRILTETLAAAAQSRPWHTAASVQGDAAP